MVESAAYRGSSPADEASASCSGGMTEISSFTRRRRAAMRDGEDVMAGGEDGCLGIRSLQRR